MQMWSALPVISTTRVPQRSAHASHRSCHGRGSVANQSIVLLVLGQLS